MNRIRVHRTMAFAIRGLAGASCAIVGICGASLLVTGCASSGSSSPGSSRAIEAAGYPITTASDSDCNAMQRGKASLSAAGDLPPFSPDSGLTDYPAEARRLAERGSVDLTFSIDGAGQPVHIKQVCSAKPRLAVSAVRALTSLHFLVPPNWGQVGGAAREFAFEFQYRLVDVQYRDVRYRKVNASTLCGQSTFGRPRIPDAQVVPVCGVRIWN